MDSQATPLVGLIGPRRKALRLSMQKAAEAARVHRLTWSAWEKGQATPEEYNYAGIDTALQLPAGTVAAAIAGKPYTVPEPGAGDVEAHEVRSASPEKLAEMYLLVEDELGTEEADRFLRRVIELRRQGAQGSRRARGRGGRAVE